MSGKIFEHDRSTSKVFTSPTGRMLWSFSMSSLILRYILQIPEKVLVSSELQPVIPQTLPVRF